MTEPERADELYLRLLSELHEARIADDPRIQAVLDQTRKELISTPRRCADELGRIDCAGRPDLASRIAAETAWLGVLVQSMGGLQS